MKVLDPGHSYQVDVYPHDPRLGVLPFAIQKIDFVKKVGENYPGNHPPEHPGTNLQELLRVLINRLEYLNNQNSADENLDTLSHLRLSLYLNEKRAARLKGIKFLNTPHIEELQPCKICGHIFPHDSHAESHQGR